MGFWKRAKNRLVITKQRWKNDKAFSCQYAFSRVFDELGGRIGLKRLSQFAHGKKNQFIIAYLENGLDPVINKYRNEDCEGEQAENAPVWVCWWTGFDSAPALVKQCIRSITANAGKHPVILITEETVSKYLIIPEYIREKHQIHKMGTAHFCDYIRIALLEKYGGLWLDATVFCAYNIPEYFFQLPFFTCKGKWRESRYLSHYQWTTFCLAGWKGNTVFSFLKEAFEKYWLDNDGAIDYLFFDHLIYVGREHIPAIKKFMDAVPENNPHIDDLQEAMNAAIPAGEFWSVVHSETPIYKLSWRETYSELTVDGQQSAYGYFLNMEV